jgi:ribosome-binding factor A
MPGVSVIGPFLYPALLLAVDRARRKALLGNATICDYMDGMAKNSNRDGKAPTQRMLRVGEMIRRTLSEVLQRGDVHDEELERMSITVGEVRMTPDLSIATAFILPLGGNGKEEALSALRRNRYEIRHLVVKGGTMKFAPELRFEIDGTFDQMDATRALLAEGHVRQDIDD